MIRVCERILPGDVIAVGDIHGTWEPYLQFLDWVEDSQAVVVLLGDLIDRGGRDLDVLEATRRRLDDPEKFGLGGFHTLKGNHEIMFLEAVSEDLAPFRTSTVQWIRNGGNARDKFEMANQHKNWLDALPVWLVIGETLFVHSGVFPGRDPQEAIREGLVKDLLWERKSFLRWGPEFEKWNPRLKRVVHGHTPTIFEENNKGFAPVVKDDRVNIDTGACFEKGFLTAFNVTQNKFRFFRK